MVFAEETKLPKLRRLKPGFRHCYAYMALPGGWIGIDSLSYMTELKGFYDWLRRHLARHFARLGSMRVGRAGANAAASAGAATAVFLCGDGEPSDRPAKL